MRQALRAFAIGAVLGLAGAAVAGIRLGSTASKTLAWTNCDGGLGQNVAAGSYLASFKDEVTWLCIGDAGCAAGGHFFSPGLALTLDFVVTTPVSCRSDAMTGDAVLTQQP